MSDVEPEGDCLEDLHHFFLYLQENFDIPQSMLDRASVIVNNAIIERAEYKNE